METLLSPKNNLEWAKMVGVIPIHNGADQDAHFKTEQFKGWFDGAEQRRQVSKW